MNIFDSDPNPKIIATIEKNHFTVNPNNYFKVDWSRDHSRLAITDQHNVKVLSLDYLNKGSLQIDAVLYFPDIKGSVRITEDGIFVEDHDIASNDCLYDNNPRWPEISIYPSTPGPRGPITYHRKAP